MSDGFSRYDTITEFRDAFPGAGLVAPAEIIADGEWHRCDVAGKRPRNEDGRYKLYTDRWPAGVLQNFVEGRLDIWHPEDRGRKVSAEERAERKRFADQAWADAVAETVDEQAVVATGLELRWGWMTECDGSQYLARKRVGAHGVRAHMFGSIFYVPVRDIDGKLWNLQEIWSDGSKLFQKGGRVTGCFHTIGDLVDGEPIQIGEGYATCASAFESNGVTTIVAFDAGNMPRVAKALRERYSLSPITLLADDDAATRRDKGRNPGIDKATEAALAVGGKIAIPDFGPDRRDDQTDFNDLHLSVGFAAVRRQIAEARDPDPVEPTYAAPIHTVDLATARAEQARIMSGFAHDSVKWLNRAIYDLNRPPVVAVNGSPGLGKTHEALRTVVTAALQDGRQVMIFVDKHNLGEQQARDLAAMGIKARTYRARGADDPVTGGTMCLETDRTGAIDGSLGDVSTLACKSAKGVCEFYETCGYQRQKKDPPEVWLAAHQMLFYKLPPFIPQPDIVIIDERFDDAGEEKDVVLDLSLLVHNRDAGFSREDIEKGYLADLRAISEKVYAVLVQLRAPGALRSDMFTITAEDARVAHGLEWKRKLPLDDIVPGMPAAKAIERALLRRDHNQDVSTLTKFWEALAATLQNDFEESLYLRFDANCTVPGSKATVPGVVISARRELQDAIKNIPVLHLDGTMSEPVVRQFFPYAAFHDIAVKFPPMTTVALHQVTDRQLGKSATTPKLLEEYRRIIEVTANSAPGRVGVICLKDIEEELIKGQLKGQPLPPRVALRHFGAVTGMNDFGDVSDLILIGRPEPAPYSVEKQARLLFKRPVEEIAGYYPRARRGMAVRGSADAVPVEGSQHPDPGAEALRWLACEAELIQAIHRARPINRTPASPLQIQIVTNVCLPIEIDFPIAYEDAVPLYLEVMLARGAVWLSSYADMAAAYPDLFSSEEAARAAIKRERDRYGVKSLRVFLLRSDTISGPRIFAVKPAGSHRELTPYRQVQYRRTGAPGRTPSALIDDRVDDPLALLRERLRCEVVLVADRADESGPGDA